MLFFLTVKSCAKIGDKRCKSHMRSITIEDIEAIRTKSVWDLGNDILYEMCEKYPGHDEDNEIIAKIWLIGRSYAAAIERRKRL
jgi:hypothetical protein